MNPTLKKILTAVALKKVYDRVQEARAPKRSKAAKVAPALTLLGAAGVGGYLFKSGKLQELMGGGNEVKDEPAAYPTGGYTTGETVDLTTTESTSEPTTTTSTTPTV